MGLWEWGNFGSQKVRSVINGAIFNRSASNLDCTHDFWVSPPGKLGNWPYLGHIWAPFGALTLFGAQKLRCLITFDAVVHLIWNLAGFSLVMISKRWYGPKFLIFPLNRHMGMGQFWVPESAFGDKWSNFQPFHFKFGLYTWFLGISTWQTWKTNLGQFGPLLG